VSSTVGTVAKHGPYTASFEEVDPKLAEQWMATSTGNREWKAHHLRHLTRDMRAKRFPYNGDTIRFDRTGALRDGHHRLRAIISSNTKQLCLVARGIDPAAFRTIDQDRVNRSIRDLLDFRGEKNTRNLAGLILLQWRYDEAKMLSSERPTATEALEVLDEHPELRASALIGKRVNMAIPMFPIIAGWLHYRTQLISKPDSDAFFEAMLHPDQNETIPAVKVLRQVLKGWSENGIGSGEAPRRMQLQAGTAAWNAHRDGKTPTAKQLEWRPGQPWRECQ
jgi:hypothetical protein